jgi:molecular chaperone GrpE
VAKNDPARNRAEEFGRDAPGADDRTVESSADEGGRAERQDAPVAESPVAGEIDELQAELQEARDRALRIQAELENYRKRVAREIQEERRYAHLPLIRDLLPVWDNIGRAIEAAEKTHQTTPLLQGFKMVAGQLEDVLSRHHCEKIDAMGQPFDPNLHEAISQQACDDHPPHTVLTVAQEGFRLHDRVVRPSQVVVSAASSQPPPAQGGPEPEEGPSE